MVTITITGDTAKDAHTELCAMIAHVVASNGPSAPQIEIPKKRKTAEPESKAAEPTSAKVTLQDIKDIIPKVMAKIGKEGIVKMLAGPESKFGAMKGSELKEEHYEEFMALAKKSLV